MNRLFFYLLIFLSLAFHSCITDVGYELDIKPKLVLHCYLVPQMDTTILYLTNSAPLFSRPPKKIEKINNATVEISNDNRNWVKMEYDFEYEIYFLPHAQFPILEGETYCIRASATGFETVTSSCTVPHLRETNFECVMEEHTRCVHYGEIYNEPHLHSYLKWTDNPGEENYYMFYDKYHQISYDWDYEHNESISDTSAFYSWSLCWDYDGKPCIYSDKEQDGKRMSVLFSIDLPEYDKITMTQTDKHCYLHEMSVKYYEDGDMLQFFLLEPVQLYTNIKNGYGVFGAFVMREYSFELEEE